MLEIRLLGQFDVRLDGAPIEVPSRPAQTLLAYLALNAGVAHRREKLAGMLWPEANDVQARNNLRYTLWQARKALGRGEASPETYLTADKITVTLGVWCDAVEILRPVNGGSDPESLVRAASLYGGELLPGFYEDWVVLERERLRAAFESKVQRLLDVLARAERWAEVLEWSERWIAVGQASESAYRALMLAHGGMGDRAGVAAAFARCVAALQSDLGVEPSDQTRRLHVDLTQGRRPTAAALVSPAERAPHDADGIRSLLRRWREQDRRILDLSSLALVHASADLALEEEEAFLLFRSALHYEVDLGPWVARAGSHALSVLRACYREYPKPAGRMRIVEALEAMEGDASTDMLLEVVEREDSPSIRSRAALVVARTRGPSEVVETLLASLNEGRDPAALEALVAVSDEFGLPKSGQSYPGGAVVLGVAQRRWETSRGWIARQAVRAGIGAGLISGLNGALSPFYAALVSREELGPILSFVSLPAWMIAGAMGWLLIGALQGFVTGLAVGFGDAMWRGKRRRFMRTLLGATSGLVHSGILLLAASVAVEPPTTTPGLYRPVYVLYGLLLGAGLSWVFPAPGEAFPRRAQFSRWIQAAVWIGMVSLPYGLLVNDEASIGGFPRRLVFAVLLPLGMGVAVRGKHAKAPADRRENGARAGL